MTTKICPNYKLLTWPGDKRWLGTHHGHKFLLNGNTLCGKPWTAND